MARKRNRRSGAPWRSPRSKEPERRRGSLRRLEGAVATRLGRRVLSPQGTPHPLRSLKRPRGRAPLRRHPRELRRDRNPAMNGSQGYQSPGIAGSGAIATGLAAVATTTADVILLARSEASAWRAEEKVVAACAKIEGAEPSRLRVTTDPSDLSDCDVIVEAIVEEVAPKGELLATIAAACPSAGLATTTSSLSIASIAEAAGIGKLFGLHVFNPVPRMKLVEVCFPDGA